MLSRGEPTKRSLPKSGQSRRRFLERTALLAAATSASVMPPGTGGGGCRARWTIKLSFGPDSHEGRRRESRPSLRAGIAALVWALRALALTPA